MSLFTSKDALEILGVVAFLVVTVITPVCLVFKDYFRPAKYKSKVVAKKIAKLETIAYVGTGVIFAINPWSIDHRLAKYESLVASSVVAVITGVLTFVLTYVVFSSFRKVYHLKKTAELA